MRGSSAAMGHIYPTGTPKDGDDVIMPYMLIGVVLGTPGSNQYRKDFPDLATDAELNSGISIVLPVKEIIEFLHIPLLAEQRADSINARRKFVGYRGP